MQYQRKITLYTDGGARGNPGPAGAGVVIVGADGKPVKKISKFLGTQTNNWAEYEAVVLGLQAVKKIFGAKQLRSFQVEVKLDSELVARQLAGEYQIKEPTLFPQYIKVHNMQVKDFPSITFTHIPREENSEADRLANEAMDQAR
jgi:ribonuclease HI